MWTALALVALAVSSPPPDATAGGITTRTRVRLSAGVTVDVPGLYSGTRSSYMARRVFERHDDRLVFTRDDGSKETVLAPEGAVVGTLVSCEGTTIHVLGEGRREPDRVRRGSVARVEVPAGRRRGTGAMKGLGIGAVDDAVGHGGTAGWREVPLESLDECGGPIPPPPESGAARRDAAPETRWELVSVQDGPRIVVGVVPGGPLKRAVEALARPVGAERVGKVD